MSQPVKTEHGLWAVEVQGHQFEFQKWGAEEALDTLFELVSIIGRPLASVGFDAAESKSLKDAMENVSRAGVDGMVAHLTDQLAHNRPVVMALIKRLTSGSKVLCDGKAVQFSVLYQDDLKLVFYVARAALEVQYGNFFGALGDAVGLRKTAA